MDLPTEDQQQLLEDVSRRSPVRQTLRQAAATPSRKKGTACSRCRTQKTRCDDGQPCRNCSKVGRPCIRPGPNNNLDGLGHIQQRLQMLEESFRKIAPQELEHVIALTPGVPHYTEHSDHQKHHHCHQVSDSYHAGPFESDRTESTWVFDSNNGTEGIPENRARSLPANDVFNAPSQGDTSPVETEWGATNVTSVNHTDTTRSNANANPTNTASPAVSTQIKPSEPLAHDVGLLSLANSDGPKYLGPSSGVPFARLILTAIPQSQGLTTSLATPGSATLGNSARPDPFPLDWSFEVDPKHFVDAYFETYQPLYPFLDEDSVVNRLDSLLSTQSSSPSLHSTETPSLADVESRLPAIQSVQLMLIIALGARISETRLSADFSSERYLVTAMSRIDRLSLHESIEGVQIMLLLTLCSFCFVDGPNAWFLTSNIIATCLDLGFQRKWVETGLDASSSPEYHSPLIRNNVRRGIFWSAYSLERTLAVVLGRPLTLRDEAIDVEFPGVEDAVSIFSEVERARGDTRPDDPTPPFHESKRRRLQASPYNAAQYSFRFDQLTAEMKLMLYRVQNAPGRFPWLKDTPSWQQDAHQRCKTLAEDMLNDLKRYSRRGMSDSLVRTLELKYHQCLMLLHRPSPAVPRPSLTSWKTCYSSAVRTISISVELSRFSKLSNSWLTAHTIFVGGITFLYCLWVKPGIKEETSFDSYNRTATSCINLLQFLGKTWSVAADALSKFERLVQLTTSSWRAHQQQGDSTEMAAGHSLMTLSNQAQDCPAAPQAQASEINEAELPTFWGGEQSQYEPEPQLFFNELGEMSSWFDLDWIMNSDHGELTR